MDVQQEKTDPSKFWALIELFGHSQIAGEVSEFTLGGESFIRVDVPAVGEQHAFTKMYGGKAIYAISPMDKEGALALVGCLDAKPIQPYQMANAFSAYVKERSISRLSHDDDNDDDFI